jgi:CheY-like chemotaxis protein
MNRLPRILVVDDEQDITDTYKLLFELHGFEAVTAGNGAEALALVARMPPDLVLTDCRMPTMDGLELARRLRAIPSLAMVPVILMSGAPEMHDLSIGSHVLFLQKPLLFERLLHEVRRLLGIPSE